MDKRLPAKKSVNLLLDSNLIKQAKASNINLSATLDKALRQALAERWATDNADAIKAYNERIERDGLWTDSFRQW